MTIKSNGRGFTLIELLVVIAIIGILSSVVLASLNTARSKGSDAKIKSEMAALSTNAELLYDTGGSSYATSTAIATGVCPSAAAGGNIFSYASNYGILSDIRSIAAGTNNIDCNVSATAFGITAQLNDTSNGTLFFCVDSTGYRGTTSAALAAADYTCL